MSETQAVTWKESSAPDPWAEWRRQTIKEKTQQEKQQAKQRASQREVEMADFYKKRAEEQKIAKAAIRASNVVVREKIRRENEAAPPVDDRVKSREDAIYRRLPGSFEHGKRR